MANGTITRAAQRAAARATAAAAEWKAKDKLGLAAAAAPVALLAMATPAYAATSNPITKIFNSIEDSVLKPIYYGLIGIVAILACIILIKEIIQAATAGPGGRKNDHIAQCVVILGICLVCAFLPEIIKWVVNTLAGTSGTGYGDGNGKMHKIKE